MALSPAFPLLLPSLARPENDCICPSRAGYVTLGGQKQSGLTTTIQEKYWLVTRGNVLVKTGNSLLTKVF
jgi:hypothetical protein